jgi:aryl-alcohol dehydrogenase-like predicted oxidoreductase
MQDSDQQIVAAVESVAAARGVPLAQVALACAAQHRRGSRLC